FIYYGFLEILWNFTYLCWNLTYLYRAIDSTGATIDFFLSPLRSADAAKVLLAKALADPAHPQPRVINTDKAQCYPAAISESKEEGVLRSRCRHRPVQYLNNILEQDHRAIRKRSVPSSISGSSVLRGERFKVTR
ncbi:MAG: DDE-type integrase/transposase/recombinase, partial [Terriglobia bacterium]